MLKLIKTFVKDEDGASLIEYSLLVGLISVVIIGSITLISTDLGTIWANLQSVIAVAAA